MIKWLHTLFPIKAYKDLRMEHDYSGVITLIVLVAILLSLFVFNRHKF